MTYVVTGACMGERHGACTEVCPCGTFHYGDHEGAPMMVIDPESCIDCGACALECPVGAIVADTETTPEWAAYNAAAAAVWPNAHDDADGWTPRRVDEPPLGGERAPVR